MLSHRSNPISGFTLVELLVSLVTGLLVISAGISIFANTAGTDFYQLKLTRLNQELRSTMNLMTRDIRRIGYIGPAGLANIIGTGTWNPMVRDSGGNLLFVLYPDPATNPVKSCVVFAIDENQNGADDGNSEHYGYRFSANSVQMRSANSQACDSTTLGSSGWQNITDDKTTKITSLTFTPRSQIVGNLVICTLDISLSGELLSDSSVKRTINESVKLRNDIYVPTGGTSPCQ